MTPAVSELTLLSFNAGLLRLSAFGQALVEPSPWVEARAAALAPALRKLNADIVCLQEIHASRHRDALRAALADIYPHAAWPAPGRVASSGLVLLSKFPIAAHRFCTFGAGPLVERWLLRKGYQDATLRIEDGRHLRLFNLQLSAGGSRASFNARRGEGYRARQIDQLLAAAALPTDAALMLLAGDLHAGPSASIDNHAPFAAAGWVDLYARHHGAAATPASRSGDYPFAAHGPHRHRRPQRVDRIYARANAPLAVVDAQVVLTEPVVSLREGIGLSDHFGVCVRIAI